MKIKPHFGEAVQAVALLILICICASFSVLPEVFETWGAGTLRDPLFPDLNVLQIKLPHAPHQSL